MIPIEIHPWSAGPEPVLRLDYPVRMLTGVDPASVGTRCRPAVIRAGSGAPEAEAPALHQTTHCDHCGALFPDRGGDRVLTRLAQPRLTYLTLCRACYRAAGDTVVGRGG